MSDQYTEDGRAADAGADKEERAIIERARQAITLPIEALRIGMRVRVINPDYAQDHEGIIYEIVGLRVRSAMASQYVLVMPEGDTIGGGDEWNAKSLEPVDGDAFTLLVLSLQAQIDQAGKDRNALTAAQTTIAELRAELAAFVTHHEATDAIIADAAGERPETGKALLFTLDQLRTENAVLRADRDNWKNTHTHAQDLLLEETNRSHSLRAQLATAIAERDEELLKWGVEPDEATVLMRERNEAIKARDSALAACAAKDILIQEAVAHWSKHYEAELESCEKQMTACKLEGDIYGVNFHEGRQSGLISHDIALDKLKRALSPNAGRDYVPKGPMVELLLSAEVVSNCIAVCGNGTWTGFTESLAPSALKRFESALGAAAPYLATDSTGEEKA